MCHVGVGCGVVSTGGRAAQHRPDDGGRPWVLGLWLLWQRNRNSQCRRVGGWWCSHESVLQHGEVPFVSHLSANREVHVPGRQRSNGQGTDRRGSYEAQRLLHCDGRKMASEAGANRPRLSTVLGASVRSHQLLHRRRHVPLEWRKMV